MKHRSTKVISTLAIAVVLSGCGTVKMPNVDFLKLPEFRDEANNIKSYPKVSDAPTAPTDVRSDQDWDKAAKTLISSRNQFDVPKSGKTYANDRQVKGEMRSLKDEVRAYKLDDPQ